MSLHPTVKEKMHLQEKTVFDIDTSTELYDSAQQSLNLLCQKV